jgi:hypothetical protein
MIRNNPHAIAHAELALHAAYVDKPVLLVYLREHGIVRLNNLSKAHFARVRGAGRRKTFDPPSIIICPFFAVETMVVRIDAAHSSNSHAPLITVLRSLKMYVPGRISFKSAISWLWNMVDKETW